MVGATASSILSFAHCFPGDVSISCIFHFFKVCGLNMIQASNRRKQLFKSSSGPSVLQHAPYRSKRTRALLLLSCRMNVKALSLLSEARFGPLYKNTVELWKLPGWQAGLGFSLHHELGVVLGCSLVDGTAQPDCRKLLKFILVTGWHLLVSPSGLPTPKGRWALTPCAEPWCWR